MLDTKNLIELARHAVRSNKEPQATFSYGDKKFSVKEADSLLSKEFSELMKDYATMTQNLPVIYQIINAGIDEALPQRVLEQYGRFAEVKVYANGDKPRFVQRITAASKRRAKQYVTRVGLAGRYEVFRLDGKSYEIQTNAYGAAAQVSVEEMRAGRFSLADFLEVILEGLDEAIYVEIERALKSSIETLGDNNKHSNTSFNELEMDRLLAVADSYGKSSIYCTYEFAATMLPSDGWVSEEMKNQKWNNGYLGNYKGHKVIVFQQSFEDETNSKKVIDPRYAWIIPDTANKPIQIAIEGSNETRQVQNEDWSIEFQTYKKLGVGAIITNDICVYTNTSLAR